MKTLLLSLAAVSALAAATPAAAQSYDWNRYQDRGRHNDVRWPDRADPRGAAMMQRISDIQSQGDLAPSTANRLRHEVSELQGIEARRLSDGYLSSWERSDLDRRWTYISNAIDSEAARGARYHNRYDNDRDGYRR
jgi:hypothetical protein